MLFFNYNVYIKLRKRKLVNKKKKRGNSICLIL